MTTLGRTILVLSFFVGVTGCRAKSEAPAESAVEDPGVGPALAGTPPQVQLLLPSRFEEALAAAGGNFVTVAPAEFGPGIVGGPVGGAARWSEREAPFAVLADFDGNGAQD